MLGKACEWRIVLYGLMLVVTMVPFFGRRKSLSGLFHWGLADDDVFLLRELPHVVLVSFRKPLEIEHAINSLVSKNKYLVPNVTVIANDGVVYNISLHEDAPKPEWIVNKRSPTLAQAWNLAITSHPEAEEFLI
ncbi:unnamed protein product, partial [Heterosigma akashiwo]